MGKMDIKLEWTKPEDPGNAFGPEVATWARLEIAIDDVVITRNSPADWKSERDKNAVSGGMSGLVEWLVENWKYILWETYCPFPKPAGKTRVEGAARVPGLRDVLQRWRTFDLEVSPAEMASWQHRHTFGHATSDIALPSIVFLPEERKVGVAVDQQPTTFRPTVIFASDIAPEALGQPVWIPKDDFVSVVEGLISKTITKAENDTSARKWAEWVDKRWDEAKRAAADRGERRRLMYGEFIAERWEEIASRLGDMAPAFVGILQDSGRINDDTLLKAMEDVVREAAGNGTGNTGGWMRVRRNDSERMLPPYEQGYRLASRARKFLSEPDAPLPELSEVMRSFGVSVHESKSHETYRSAVVARRNGSAGILHATDHPSYRAVVPTRFAIAAALGRLLAEGDASGTASFGAAHGEKSRWMESQRANAFAAEFLLPAAAQRKNADIEELSEEYGISRTAARWHVHNRGSTG